MKITIMGTGAYSIGIALMLAKKENNYVTLWTENEAKLEEFNKTHKISSIFDVNLPDNVSVTNSYEKALEGTELIFLITSAKYILSVCKNILPFYKNTPICIASKGIDNETLSPLSSLVRNTLNTKNICVISGPTFAIDLVNNEPTALAIAGYNKNVVKIVKKTLENDTLKLRVSSDIIGIQ